MVVSINFRKLGARRVRRVASPYDVWSWQSIGFDEFSPEKQRSQTIKNEDLDHDLRCYKRGDFEVSCSVFQGSHRGLVHGSTQFKSALVLRQAVERFETNKTWRFVLVVISLRILGVMLGCKLHLITPPWITVTTRILPFLVGYPSINLHLWLESWVGGYTEVISSDGWVIYMLLHLLENYAQ